MKVGLDVAMERSIAINNPADAGKWGELARQYRSFIPLRRVVTGAGTEADRGIITSTQLRLVVIQGHGRGNYGTGSSDFSDLIRAGREVLQPLPNSGTAGRLSARNLGANLPTLLGAMGGA